MNHNDISNIWNVYHPLNWNWNSTTREEPSHVDPAIRKMNDQVAGEAMMIALVLSIISVFVLRRLGIIRSLGDDTGKRGLAR